MSFIDGFFTFNIDLVNVESNIYKKLLFKICKHPDENYAQIISKALVYCHTYEDDISFSQGAYSPEDPTIWCKDIIGNIHLWVQLGAPSYKKLHRAIKQNTNSKFKIYFTSREEIQNFCYEFRAIKTKDFQNIAFYLLDSDFIEKISTELATRNTWNLSIVDNILYLNCDKLEFEGKIEEVDIWKEYQTQICNL